MAIYGRFSEAAQRVLGNAREAALETRQPFVGTQHLLLGLLKDADQVPGCIAELMTYDQVLSMLGSDMPEGMAQEHGMRLDLSPRTKKVLEMSILESRKLGSIQVEVNHLWLALLRQGDGMAYDVLRQLKVDMAKVRAELLQEMQGSAGSGPEAGDPASHILQTVIRIQGNATPEAIANAINMAGRTANNAKPEGKQQSASKTPNLDKYCRDLTAAAKANELDPVIGRDRELQRIVQILIRRTKNNPVLIGEPGVGKSAVVEALAQRIVNGVVPEMLMGKRVMSLDLGAMVAGTKYRGEFEERLKECMNEIRKDGSILLFIDEMHTIVGAGASEGSLDAANILKPALARGEMQCIGATTMEEYRKHIEKNAALERRFQPVMVGEPSADEAMAILHGLRERYEAHHKVRITDEALHAAVTLSDRYIQDRFLPDKAIDLMDEAASRVRIRSYTTPEDVKKQELQLENLLTEKKDAVAHQDYEKAAALRDQERILRQEIEEKRAAWAERQTGENQQVTEEDIAQIVSTWTGIPVNRMTETESQRLLHLEETLHQRVIGQEEAVSAVSRAIRRARAGLKDPKRPIGSFIFLGPTGVGKTELCKALGEAVFGDEDAVIRVDMSEFMEKHSVSRLVGSPPGYVGYEEGGQLTEAVRRKPYAVVLLDEVEKAHPDVFNILLQILDDGRLTDNTGRVVSFKNTIIVMTSNAGAHEINQKRAMGFGASAMTDAHGYEMMKDAVMKQVKDLFRPEFINRVDELIVFHSLGESEIHAIASLMLRQLSQRLEERDVCLTWDEEVVSLLAREGYDAKYGARPLRRVIQRTVEDMLSEELIAGHISLGDDVKLTVANGVIAVQRLNEEEDGHWDSAIEEAFPANPS